jgi:hypothetical protein
VIRRNHPQRAGSPPEDQCQLNTTERAELGATRSLQSSS